ncbi:MAG: Rrf2 family transcriptional regulator [Proteobacteria bacterium]|nr:MAG: Rrf2 family transcriptional regulator [Pseudomonadota bacterium]
MASVNTQFSIAVHLLAGIASRDGLVTSEALSMSVNTNQAFVKRVLAKLSAASLIRTVSGKLGGCELAKKPRDISLLDVYQAIEAPGTFAIHQYPAVKSCQVSSNIKAVLGGVLESAQKSFEKDLDRTTIADVVARLGFT